MTRPPTLYMRIHKTAGEALAKQVSDSLPAAVICPEEFEWQIRNLPEADLRRYRFFQGHISPPALSLVFPRLQVFTMLRSPRERLLSCYFYWKEGAKHADTEFFKTIAEMSLFDFLQSETPIIRRVTWNVQARLLADGQFGGINEHRQAVFGPWLTEPELADKALHDLDRFAFVGCAEKYDLTIRKAYALLELGNPPPSQRINVTPNKPSSYDELLATPSIAEALSRLTGADQVVYDEVCRQLDAEAPT